MSPFEPPRDKTNKLTCAPSEDSGWSESSLCAQWVAKDPSLLHADSEYSDQAGRMPRLIRVFAGHTYHFVGFVMRRLIWHTKTAPSVSLASTANLSKENSKLTLRNQTRQNKFQWSPYLPNNILLRTHLSAACTMVFGTIFDWVWIIRILVLRKKQTTHMSLNLPKILSQSHERHHSDNARVHCSCFWYKYEISGSSNQTKNLSENQSYLGRNMAKPTKLRAFREPLY